MFQRLWSTWTGRHRLPVYSKVSADDAQRFSLDSFAYEEQRLLDTIRIQRRSIFGLLCLSFVLVVTLLGQVAYNTRASWLSTEPVPRMPHQTLTFEKDSLYASSSNTESDLAWKALVPPTKGFVKIKNAAKYGLPEGMNEEQQSGHLYNVAAFHQIHCLTSIREHLWHMQSAVERNQTEQMHDILPESQDDYIVECFDYIRQSLMCAGDMTLEYPPPKAESTGKHQVVTGWGVKHQCVSWDAILHFTETNSPAALSERL